MPWRIEKRGEQHCVIKEATNESEGCHDSREQAERQMAALYASEDNLSACTKPAIFEAPNFYVCKEHASYFWANELSPYSGDKGCSALGEIIFIENDNFATLKPGNPIRLFPFGKLTRGDRTIDFTKEMAQQVKLPRYKPAIKLGNHEDATPAGGYIESLFVGEDGLYAMPALTEKGAKAMNEGDFRYHSPEILWAGELEDVVSGPIPAPVITGLALLHDPALGGAAALYQVEKENKEKDMSVTIDQLKAENEGLLQRLTAFLKPKEVLPEDYETVKAEAVKAQEYKVELERLDAERKQAELYKAIVSKFDTEEFGAAYKAISAEDGAVDVLSSMTEEQREWTLTKLSALSAQIDESGLTGTKGSDKEGTPDDPNTAINEAVLAYQKENKVDYVTAFEKVREASPALFARE